MSSLAYKRQLEQIAGLSQDTAGMSGADLAQAALLSQSNVPALGANMDGARLTQIDYRGAKDDFTGPNAALGGRYLKNSPNRVWATSAGGWSITSNQLVHDGVASVFAVVDTGMVDNFAIRTKIIAITGQGPQYIIRADAASVASLVVWRNQTTNIWTLYNNTGPVTIDTQNDATDLVPNDVVEIQVRGNAVTVLVNGTVRCTLNGAAGLYPNGSRQGFVGWAGNAATIDDFYAYHLA